MYNQRNESNVKLGLIFIGIIILFYLGYFFLSLLSNVYLQIIFLLVLCFELMHLIYKIFPNYIYKIIDSDFIIVREFSLRYSENYKIKIEDIDKITKNTKKTIKFWNQFYNYNRVNMIYEIQTKEGFVIQLDGSEEFIMRLKEKMEGIYE